MLMYEVKVLDEDGETMSAVRVSTLGWALKIAKMELTDWLDGSYGRYVLGVTIERTSVTIELGLKHLSWVDPVTGEDMDPDVEKVVKNFPPCGMEA